ncbi:MAG: hypothetical protein M3317_11665 [Actinomycetota bacterium]|nr:hypothetical protein [Actinomycetota bacterium]
MPEFVSRWWGWFQARTGVQRAGIAVVVLIVLVLLSRVVWIVASMGFVLALLVLIYRLARRRPVRTLAIATVVLLATGLLFGGVSNAIYGPIQQDQANVLRVHKPQSKKPQPAAAQQSKPKPPSKPEEKAQQTSLYRQAVTEPLAPYKVDYISEDTAQRFDAYVVAESTTNKPKLGRILIDLQENSGEDPDLVTAVFCTKPGKQRCTDTQFAYGEYAATAQGKSFMTGEQVLSKVGKWPFIKVEF